MKAICCYCGASRLLLQTPLSDPEELRGCPITSQIVFDFEYSPFRGAAVGAGGC